MKPERYIASFDSASGFLRALSRSLAGRDFRGLGVAKLPAPVLSGIGTLANRVPERARKELYILGGWWEAISPTRLRAVDFDAVARWAVSQYPRRRYPAIMVGSSNGAAMHLCAALGIPWLPQTFLVPIRQSGVDPDDSTADMAAAAGWGRALLDANPDVQLHHMHDANQDRLMIQRMTYFRVKRLRLGSTFAGFITDTLEPGGTIFICDCRLRWPTTAVSERHVFQHGALGGATVQEVMEGGPRVAEFLARQGSQRTGWRRPAPDGDRPEAEWGFADELSGDVVRLCRSNGYRCRRIVFDHPEDLSPLVADLYRVWLQEHGVGGDRLIIDSFLLTEPRWTIDTGHVPYWSVFPVEDSAARAELFLRGRAFARIGALLFSHGTESIGLAPAARWSAMVAGAGEMGQLAGVDPKAFPRDFGVFARYWPALQRIARRDGSASPPPMRLAELDRFLQDRGDDYAVAFTDEQGE